MSKLSGFAYASILGRRSPGLQAFHVSGAIKWARPPLLVNWAARSEAKSSVAKKREASVSGGSVAEKSSCEESSCAAMVFSQPDGKSRAANRSTKSPISIMCARYLAIVRAIAPLPRQVFGRTAGCFGDSAHRQLLELADSEWLKQYFVIHRDSNKKCGRWQRGNPQYLSYGFP